MPEGPRPYPDVPAAPDLPAVEEDILASWAADSTFAASVARRPAGANEYVFYDGPPFANGLPHYGHLLTGFVKDAIPRYQTMRGRRVERRFGWDCHGLPAETEAEKELGVSGRGPITRFGIDRFNEYCRTSVLRYTHEWERYVTRQARWVDFQNDYKTMDLSYMESVMWAIKRLWEKGLLYEGFRVLPYCWECETPLSNFEIRQDNSYRDRQDPAVTVAFRLDGEPLTLWVWTTTPWTLPSNLALAVGPEIDYVVFSGPGPSGPERIVLAEAAVGRYEKELAGYSEVERVKGATLIGRTYTPLFPYFAGAEGAFRVLAADFVTTGEGTGIVHMAPGFGEDDQRVCEAAGIAVVAPVDDRGRFTDEVIDYRGVQVFDANQPIVRALRARHALVRQDSLVHSYPHCWRTDTPLIYKAVGSWFVRVTEFRDRMVELNREITWVPPHVRDGSFGKWLENARDWSISRNRFWGSPLPVWKSDDPAYPRIDVYGSLAELAADFGEAPADLHRPYIDTLTRPNPDDPSGQSTMRRVSDVLDCWFESGSMPYAQVHYPFENAEWFEGHFPGDFIVEYIGQTRGWFYTLHVLATALFDRPAFRTCLAHGILLGDDGQKMSKRLRNYPDPEAMFVKYGADAMRWFLLSSPVLRGGDMPVKEGGIRDAVRSAIYPLWNAWYFFTLYANADGIKADIGRTAAPGALDRYVLAKLRQAVETATVAMDSYDISGACTAVEDFLDALTNWYIRRSRDRFWGTAAGLGDAGEAAGLRDASGTAAGLGDAREAATTDQQDAFDTLATVLEVLTRLAAPLLPLTAESVWRGLTSGDSVHLADWPDAAALPADPDLVAVMDRVRQLASAAHSIRKARGLRARLPLASLTVAGADAAALAPFEDLIKDEVNVKSLVLTPSVGDVADEVMTVVFKQAAPRLGPLTQQAAAAARQGDWEVLAGGQARVGPAILEPGEWDLRLTPKAPVTSRVLPGDNGVVLLDVDLTAELEEEGYARDVVRLIQQARRDRDLRVTDRITVAVLAPADVAAAVATHRDWIAEQVLAIELTVSHPVPVPAPVGGVEATLPDGRTVWLAITPVTPPSGG